MIKKLLLILIYINFALTAQAAEKIKPFRTDYCTGYAEGTFYDRGAWKHCCLTHDLFFWAGGTLAERDKADLDLKSCVEDTGHPYQAKLIYIAVRTGSRSPVKFPDKKWNNAWPLRPDDQALTKEDIDRLEEHLSEPAYNYISSPFKDLLLRELRSR